MNQKLSSTFLHEVFDILCEALTVDKVLNIDVHTVTPVVRHNSRHVDALLVGIGEAQLLVHSEPVLNAQYAEH